MSLGVSDRRGVARLVSLSLGFFSVVLTLSCGDQGGESLPDDSARRSQRAGLEAAANDSANQGALLRLGQAVNPLAGRSSVQLAVGTRHQLPLTNAESVSVLVEDYVAEEGRVALTGSVENAEGSSFLLKSEGDRLFGWVVLRGSNRAYLYEAEGGTLEAREVPIEVIYPVCNVQSRQATQPLVQRVERGWSAPRADEPWIGSYNGEDLNKLQSRPGAAKVLYLNIGESMNGDTPKDFSKEEMWYSWASVAAGYSAFDVNVTTDPSVYEAAGVTNSGIADFAPTNEVANCPLGAFGTRSACKIYTGPGAEPEQGYGVGRTTLHEFGHLLGMLHDGAPGEEYFPGLREFDWAPIMGNYYSHSGPEALNQWSKGEYSGANRQEDDLAIISENLPYVDDDVPDTKPLQLTGENVSSDVNRGQIAPNTDSDAFSFTIAEGGGHATLNIKRIEYYGGSMLDVDARLLDGSGNEMAQSNPKAARGATIDIDLPAGDYQLLIQGGAEGTPEDGFSAYSSLGYYGIEGTISNATDGNGTGGTGMGTSTTTGGMSTGVTGMGGSTTGGTGTAVTGMGGSTTTGGTAVSGTNMGGTDVGGLTMTGAAVGGTGVGGLTTTAAASMGGASLGGATSTDAGTTDATSTTAIGSATTSVTSLGAGGASTGVATTASNTLGAASTGVGGPLTSGAVPPAALSPPKNDTGCGCRLAQESNVRPPLALGMLLLGALASRRRRRLSRTRSLPVAEPRS